VTERYVALGSSMAAGPGIPPAAKDAPLRARRSAANYPHLVAQRLRLDLVDVTYSGATTAHVLTDAQHGTPPQVEVLDGSEALVTITIGGNDVGYVPMLTRAPRATVLFVDYLTLLPPAGEQAPPLSGADAALGRRIADTLERLTGEAAADTGCRWVRAAEASRSHHAWSADPWTTRFHLLDLFRPGIPKPLHPNAAGMRAVADLVIAQAGSRRSAHRS